MKTSKAALAVLIVTNVAAVHARRERSQDVAKPPASLELYLVDEGNLPFLTEAAGKGDVARMLASIGVSVRWHKGISPKSADPRPIEIHIRPAPAQASRNALGAADLRGRVITIYPERILDLQARMPGLAPALFGAVLAHEIGHVLQGVSRHSDTGILKAQWTGDDYASMIARKLSFTPQDVEQIWRGPVLNRSNTDWTVQQLPSE